MLRRVNHNADVELAAAIAQLIASIEEAEAVAARWYAAIQNEDEMEAWHRNAAVIAAARARLALLTTEIVTNYN